MTEQEWADVPHRPVDDICMKCFEDWPCRAMLHDCGYPTDSFPCRIRHVNVNVENLRRGH